MTTVVEAFIRDFWQKHGPCAKILDVGSYNENGSVRQIITNMEPNGITEFIGVDIRKDSEVDLVINGHDLSTRWKKPYFNLVTCTEGLEHDLYFWLTVEEMKKVLKPGGWLLVTTPGPAHEFHAYPSDYYRFFDTVYRELIFKDFTDVYVVSDWSRRGDVAREDRPDAVMGYGRKPLEGK